MRQGEPNQPKPQEKQRERTSCSRMWQWNMKGPARSNLAMTCVVDPTGTRTVSFQPDSQGLGAVRLEVYTCGHTRRQGVAAAGIKRRVNGVNPKG